MPELQALLQQSQEGNRNAFSEVVRRFQDMALALAVKRTNDPHLAQDAVQEAFMAAYLNIGSLRDPKAFSAWFRRILTASCSRVIAASRRREIPCSEVLDSLPGSEPSPPDIMTRHQDQAMVTRILDSLGGLDREACLLRFVHGMAYAEIAAALDTPLGTVKRRLHEAKNRIISEFNRQEQRSVRLGYLPVSDHLLAMIAHHHHDRNAYGLQIRRFLSWARLANCLKNGSLDAAFVMAPLAMALRNQGLPIKYVLDGHHDGSAITVSQRTNGSLAGGECMALPHAASTHRLLLHAMVGPDRTDKQNGLAGRPGTQVVNPSCVINSLQRREIDGFFCAEPWSTKSVAQGVGRILARSGDLAPGHICCILVVREDFASKHEGLLNSLLRSLRQAGDFVTSNPHKSAGIQARYTGVDRDLAEHILVNRHIVYQDLEPCRSRAEHIHQLALDAGVLDRPCDLDAFLYS
ncbi:MAG: sigma-70 family RNA polymerase sigma factor [Desulfovibrionaceae bacterium]